MSQDAAGEVLFTNKNISYADEDENAQLPGKNSEKHIASAIVCFVLITHLHDRIKYIAPRKNPPRKLTLLHALISF